MSSPNAAMHTDLVQDADLLHIHGAISTGQCAQVRIQEYLQSSAVSTL